jgi:serine/threonine protein kinase/outer membrane protein assembly factor BamB
VLSIICISLLLFTPCSTALPEGEQASDSSQFHGDERHAGFIATVGPTSPLLAWKINQKCVDMVASSRRLLVVDSLDSLHSYNDNYIHVINETSGVELGDIGGQRLRSRYPAIGAGNVYFSYVKPYGQWYTYAINIFSLSTTWSEWVAPAWDSVEDDTQSVKLPYNKYLFTYSKGKLFEAHTYRSQGILRARIANSGTILWEVTLDKGFTIGTIPTVADDVVVIGFLEKSMITAFSTDDGKILWSFTLDSPIASDSIAFSSYFYFGSSNGVVYAVSKDGREVWRAKLGGGVETTPAVAFGRVYVGASDGNLYALNASDGKLLWKYATGGPIVASPIVSLNGIVYVGSTDGRVYALDAKNGELVWSDNTGASIEVTPVLDNGMLFVASSDGTIRAYGRPSPSSNLPGWSLPSPPRNLTATAGPGYILLSWKPPVSSGAPENRSYTIMYNVFRGTSPGQEKFLAQVNGTSYTDLSVEPGKTYYYVVVAVNPAGASDFSNEASITALAATPPSAVSNFTVTVVGESIRLSWNPPAYTGGLPVTEYIVYRGVDPNSLSVYRTLPGNTTTFTDSNLEPGKTYYYRVQAVNAQGKGELSTMAAAVAPVKNPVSWILNNPLLIIAFLIAVVIAVMLRQRPRKREPEIPAEIYAGKTVNVMLRGPELKPLDKRLVIHGYECRSLLGKTALSATLLCTDYVGRNRVLKIPVEFYDWKVHGERVGGRRTMYSSFGGEVKVLERVSSLGHPCIVKFEKAFEAYGEEPPTLVFEFCEGGSLAKLLQEQGRLDPVTAVEIIVQIADALAAIHELGYAHGDVKPENILFTNNGIPKLADFNSARAIASTTRSIAPFTPGYAAPEHMKGIPSQKGDVWSLALVLYETVTGRNLFSSDKNEYEKELKRLEIGGKVEIRTGDSDLDAIIEKCVKLNPDKRPSMREFEEMLRNYLKMKSGKRRKG